MLKGIAAALFSATYILGVSSAAKWSANLSPQNGSKISGTASIEANGADSTRFTVSVRGATADAPLAWHLHTGKCSESGSIVGSETSYPELRPGTGGTAESMVTLPVAPPVAGSPFTIQVHKFAKAGGEGAAGAMDTPAKGSKTLVSCGELKPVGANP